MPCYYKPQQRCIQVYNPSGIQFTPLIIGEATQYLLLPDKIPKNHWGKHKQYLYFQYQVKKGVIGVTKSSVALTYS